MELIFVSKKGNIITKEIIDKMIETKGELALQDIFYRYFNKQEGDPTRPSNELALYLIKKGIDEKECHQRLTPMWLEQILGLGYIGLSELLGLIKIEDLQQYENKLLLYALFHTNQFSFPKEEKEMDEVLSKLNYSEQKTLVELLLKRKVNFSGFSRPYYNDSKIKNARNNYITFLNKFYTYFINNSYITESEAWRLASYIPTNVITNKLKNALPFYCNVKTVFLLLENKKMPLGQIIELLDFLKTFPLASCSFPYDEKCGMELILNTLSVHIEEIAAADSSLKRKLYNMFIKPLQNDPTLLEKCDQLETIISVVTISATLVSSEELMSFINNVLIQKNIMAYVPESAIIERVASIRTKINAPVPIEFIYMQEKYNPHLEHVCFNNDCINDIDFWIKRKKRLGHGNVLSYTLSFNSSFLHWFKPNSKDFPVYRELFDNTLIDFLTISKVKNLTKEFVAAFYENLSIEYMDSNVLENIIDKDIVALKLESMEYDIDTRLPESLFSLNKTFNPEFFAKYATRLRVFGCKRRTFVGSMCDIKLSDVVKALV